MGQTLLTGRLGAVPAPKLRATGHDVRPASRSPSANGDNDWVTVDLATGDGIERAVEGVDAVVHTVGELARTDCDATDRRRPVLGLPVPSATVRAFRDGEATCPDRAVGRIGWTEWLQDECVRSADTPTESANTDTQADTT